MIVAETVTFSNGEIFLILVLLLGVLCASVALHAACAVAGLLLGANVARDGRPWMQPRVPVVLALAVVCDVFLLLGWYWVGFVVAFAVGVGLGASRLPWAVRPRNPPRRRRSARTEAMRIETAPTDAAREGEEPDR